MRSIAILLSVLSVSQFAFADAPLISSEGLKESVQAVDDGSHIAARAAEQSLLDSLELLKQELRAARRLTNSGGVTGVITKGTVVFSVPMALASDFIAAYNTLRYAGVQIWPMFADLPGVLGKPVDGDVAIKVWGRYRSTKVFAFKEDASLLRVLFANPFIYASNVVVRVIKFGDVAITAGVATALGAIATTNAIAVVIPDSVYDGMMNEITTSINGLQSDLAATPR